jgi:vitamin B12 transporter
MTIIDEKAISSSGATDLGTLLSEQGFQTGSYNGASSTLTIRGFKTDEHGNDLGSHVIILLNGLRIGAGNLALLSLANVDRVEIIRGPAASQYGAAAMGGVVNVITKKGTNLPVSGQVEAGGGSFNYRRSLARIGGSSGDFDFALGAMYEKRDDFKIPTGTYYDTRFEDFAINAGVGYSFLDTHRIGLDFNYVGFTDTGMPGDAFSIIDNHTEKNNLQVALEYTGATADESLSWIGKLAIGRGNNDYYYINDPFNTEDIFAGIKTDQAVAQVTYKNKLLSLTGGLDFLQYKAENSGGYFGPMDSTYRDYAAFAIAKLHLLDDKFIVSAGGRYDSFKLEVPESNTNLNINSFTPSVGLAYIPFDFLKFRANFAGAFAMPTDMQIGSDFIASYTYAGVTYNTHYIGNPNLKPEKSHTFEFGLDVMNEYAALTATYFWSKTKNYIDTDPNSPFGYAYFINFPVAYRTGVELSLSADVAGLAGQNFELRPSIGLTHLFKMRGRTDINADYVYITGIAETNVNAGLLLRSEPIGLTANLSITRIGNKYSTVAAIKNSYSIVDLFVQKELLNFADDGHLDAKLSVQNFTDELYYSQSDGYFMPGRTFYLGLAYIY